MPKRTSLSKPAKCKRKHALSRRTEDNEAGARMVAIENPALRKIYHGPLLGASVYALQLQEGLAAMFGRRAHALIQSVVHHVADLHRRMRPRDALEEMLLTQMLWTHIRQAHLTKLAAGANSAELARVLHEACDRAANTYRRQMLAWAEYRGALKDTGIRIEQANIARQQVVQYASPPHADEEATNELGCDHGGNARKTDAPTLSTHASGATIPPSVDPPLKAMVPRHRAANRRR